MKSRFFIVLLGLSLLNCNKKPEAENTSVSASAEITKDSIKETAESVAATPEAKGVYLEQGSAVTSAQPAPKTTTAKPQDSPIMNIRWKVTEIYGKPVKNEEGNELYIELMAENNFKGNAGCNKINGHYEIYQDKIHFMRVVGTMKGCAHMETEEDFKEVLESVNNFTTADKSLQFLKGETLLAKFTAIPTPAPKS